MSKRKARRLRKAKELGAPLAQVGHGHIHYSGFGQHENKRAKALKRLRENHNDGW
jgi:hypothetical protein